MSNYVQQASFTLPQPNQDTVTVLFDVLGDGRLITSDGSAIHIENSLGSRQFTQVGAILSGVPSFIRVSPNGTQVALGDGERVFVFDSSAINTYKTFVASNFDAEWIDDAKLAISSVGQVERGTVVKVLDVKSGAMTTIIQAIAGSPAGVTIDQSGNLYSGNGLGLDPSATGIIKAFPLSEWMAPLSGGSAINFESGGTLVANLLSAAFLGFDKQGNLYVGGGDFATGADRGYTAIVSKSAIEEALAGGSPVSSASPVNKLQRLDPDPDENFWFVNSNWVTGELYLKDYFSLNVNIFKK